MNLIVGISIFLCLLAFRLKDLLVLEILLGASIFVFVPLVLMLLNEKSSIYNLFLRVLYLPSAIGAALVLAFGQTYWVLIWTFFTAFICICGLGNLLKRGTRYLEEASIDIGFIYLALGGFWLLAYEAKWRVMGFDSLTILLTAIHFHYSAFVLPISAGLLGRKQMVKGRLFLFSVTMICAGPMLIAAGITYSRIIEFMSVALYAFALYVYSMLMMKTAFRSKIAKFLLSLSSISLMATISFSMIYAFGRVSDMVYLDINQMIWIHGAVNACGVVLPALAGWLIERPEASFRFRDIPMSRIKGRGQIGEGYLFRYSLVDDRQGLGLIDSLHDYQSPWFDAEAVSSAIRQFYENTGSYELSARVRWKSWFKPLAFFYRLLSTFVQQLNLPLSESRTRMGGKIYGISERKDGRESPRAWVRKNQHGETIFVAIYSKHMHNGETYMNIALPLPFSNMTGILLPRNQENGLFLSSRSRNGAYGDEGIYLALPFIKIKLPLEESFHILNKSKSELVAIHRMWIFGVEFLEIDYDIKKRD
ncbi:YndJ family protein [Falsibacillus albus]|nr:YndJ family protein [Falsibacillus albus]